MIVIKGAAKLADAVTVSGQYITEVYMKKVPKKLWMTFRISYPTRPRSTEVYISFTRFLFSQTMLKANATIPR